MILFVKAAVKNIFELGQDFPWSKPEQCPRCGGRIRGHGFTARFFDGFAQALSLRRYRCADCRLVLTTRPQGYFSRFQASITDIRNSLTHRFHHGRWPQNLSKPRQRHWLKALLGKILCHLGGNWAGPPMDAFEQFLVRGICPVSRLI